ncbi:bifunctional phosphopantothenoylcysteine decarboxylase/phosphopantothenate--cysteine ligase CoaBC [Futiania mangrovi]|uniref:Coenzyme A biosynthesis bifunctional protein CoaBC n=1 Tax=Futiania mangrovi TaxID=2959716 RepID=A0A9J6PIR7_9PROT|nr:bifunctional phosphopantothenoylcysteine decarboxylase/phosphopantothenate--cysteine ligase CoaBC [Futiania mangrovii]MCP1336447.1 bifunctional phosphopantothenoylcysteine decarboxylase/phosphopantothenate--cysteine ligase CoaBC [Futiania mangrovii]
MSDRADRLAGARVLLIVGGGIAAYKTLDLVRRLRERGAGVRAILTRAGAEFVTPLSLAALTGDKVYQDLFSLTDEAEMGHIELSRSADVLLVAPATADLMAKMAGGQANDLATTALLATDKPVLIAPAMNVRMWEHPATQRNLATLAADGVRVVGPNDGDMACGEFGPGRMAEVPEILAAVEDMLRQRSGPLSGRHVLVTAGPTHEPIDPVRYLANRSSGRQGYAIAAALAALGARVTLVSGPTALPSPPGLATVRVETARQMMTAVEQALPADAAVCCAAVADWRPETVAENKTKKDGKGPQPLKLVENPDILASLSAAGDLRPALVVGFAAETETVAAHAKAKLARKGCDWIVANDVSPATGIMGGTENAVQIITANGIESWERMGKDAVARRLADRIAAALGGGSGAA